MTLFSFWSSSPFFYLFYRFTSIYSIMLKQSAQLIVKRYPRSTVRLLRYVPSVSTTKTIYYRPYSSAAAPDFALPADYMPNRRTKDQKQRLGKIKVRVNQFGASAHVSCILIVSPLTKYDTITAGGSVQSDPHQRSIVKHLDRLWHDLQSYAPQSKQTMSPSLVGSVSCFFPNFLLDAPLK